MTATSIVARRPIVRLVAGLLERMATGADIGPIWRASRRLRGSAQTRAVEFEVPMQANRIAEVRSRVAKFARTMPFEEEAIHEIKLAVSEAATNALRHGSTDSACRMNIRMRRLTDGLSVTVSDRGGGFDPSSVCSQAPDSLCESGRGIWFMRAVMDDVIFRDNNPGTSVELVKRFSGPDTKS